MTQQLRSQALVRTEAIQSKGGADQLLVGGRNPGKPTVEVGQKLTAVVQNTDAPCGGGRTDGSADAVLQGRTQRPLRAARQTLTLKRWGWFQQAFDSLNGRAASQRRQSDRKRKTPHGRSRPLTTPLTR